MKKQDFSQRITELIKGDKKKLIIVAVALLGIILIVLSSFDSNDEKGTEQSTQVNKAEFSEDIYTSSLEKRLEEMVSAVSGAGRTKVLVTLDCDYETVYARNGVLSKDEKSSDEKNEYIIIDSKEDENGLLLKTVTPRVRGVAVVCEGGDSPAVESAITKLLAAVLDIGTNHISVSKIK